MAIVASDYMTWVRMTGEQVAATASAIDDASPELAPYIRYGRLTLKKYEPAVQAFLRHELHQVEARCAGHIANPETADGLFWQCTLVLVRGILHEPESLLP
jgi:hypothetical protein